MAKKSLVLPLLVLPVILFWLFFIGQMNGLSGVSGDINMIDEGQFAAWVNHMFHGKILYRDFYVQYGPLQVYPLFVFIKLFGTSIFFIRLSVGVIGAFLGICVALLVLKHLSVHFLIRAITVLLLVVLPGIHIRHWVGVLCLLLIVQTYTKQSLKFAFISGVLLAATLLQSVEIGLFSIVITAGYILTRFVQSNVILKDVRILGILLLGFFSPLVIFAFFAMKEGWLLSYIGTTAEFITTISGVNLPNGQGLPDIFKEHQLSFSPIQILRFLFSKAMLFYWSLLLLLLFFSITIIRYILRKAGKKDSIVFLILCFALLTYASIIGRSGHYLIVVPFVLVCGSYFLSLVFPSNRMKDSMTRWLGILFFTLFILYAIRHVMIFRYTPFFNDRGQLKAFVPRVAPLAISQSQARDILILQAFFSVNTEPTDTIFVLNNTPALYFLVDRENATRYDLPLLAYSLEKRLEIVSSLKKHPPKFILEDQKAWAVDGVSDRKRLPEVVEYIERHYRQTKKVGNILVYEMTESSLR